MVNKISLIVSVYDALQYLEYVLFALERQSFNDFQVVIAADGSPPVVERMVLDFQKKTKLSIKYVWHPHEGFRKTTILNKAIQKVDNEYLIFIDGDCLPHCNFVEDHWRNKEQDVVLAGRRVDLSKKISESLTLEDIRDGKLERINLGKIVDYLLGRTIHLEKGIRIANRFLNRVLSSRTIALLGSNFSLYKKNILEINGFNENYQGAGIGEDVDIEFRLSLVGVKIKALKHLGIQYHLYHLPTSPNPGNLGIFERVKINREAFCKNGIIKK